MDMTMGRRTVIAGGAALALAGVGVGVAAAQGIKTPAAGEKFTIRLDEGELKARREKWLTALAAKLGVGRDKVEAALNDAASEAGLPPGLPFPPPPPGKLPDGKMVRFGFSVAFGGPEDAAAKALGMTPEQLEAERKAGRSLAEVAAARGVDPKAVQAAIQADLAAKLEKERPDPAKMAEEIMNAKPGRNEVFDYVVAKPGP